MKYKKITLIILFFMLVGLVQAQDATSDLLGRINSLRVSLGLSGYSLNSSLSVAAQNQAVWMAATGQISHTQSDGSTPTTRAVAAGYASSAVSENIYMGSLASVSSAWEWWMNSPIHYRGITNAGYSEVGIGAATGEYGQAFVLVFGNPNGWQAPASYNPSSNNSGGNAAAVPSFIVGQDNFGNIMHEIQPGNTLGDIALIYGYTWDDLEYIRSINAITEEEGRNLSIGSVLLVPPHSGTFTPTPGDPPTATPTSPPETTTEPIMIPSSTQNMVSIGAILRESATPEPPTSEPQIVVTGAVVPEWVVQTAEPVWQAATMTATPAEVAMAIIEPVTIDSPPPIEEETTTDSTSSPSPLLIGAVGFQVVLLGAAAFEFFRRMRK